MSSFDPSCIDVPDFLECLDVRNVSKATETELKFSCPYPAHAHGDEDPSAYINIETTAFFCHSCHAKGNAVHFTTDLLGITPLEAIRMLKARYSPSGINPESRNMVEEVRAVLSHEEEEPRRNMILDENALHDFDVDWHNAHRHYLKGEGHESSDYMFERGFDPDTLTEWRFGIDLDTSRITLPVRDEHGNLVGFKARVWDKRRPKYLNLKTDGFPAFLKNEIVFALDRAQHHGRDLIVVEGEWNAVAMAQKGFPNTVAINGSYFGMRQMKLIREYADSALLFFDSDTAGFDATKAVTEVLNPFMPIKIAPNHWGDPVTMRAEEIEACLAESLSATMTELVIRSQQGRTRQNPTNPNEHKEKINA